MSGDDLTGVVHGLLETLQELPVDDDSEEFTVWHRTSEATLRRLLGTDHRLVTEFERIRFYPLIVGPVRQDQKNDAFRRGRTEAIGLLSAAIFDLETLTPAAPDDDGGGWDWQLLEHVSHSIEAEKWDQVAREAAVFTEDRVREWAELPADCIGEGLWSKVLKPDGGRFPLGTSKQERTGWHQLGLGLNAAVRNVKAHHVENRDDAKRYAFGVLGLCSLMLTQLRYQHGHSFGGKPPIAEQVGRSD